MTVFRAAILGTFFFAFHAGAKELIGVDASVVFRALESIFGPEGTLCYQKFFWMGAVWPSSSLSVLP